MKKKSGDVEEWEEEEKKIDVEKIGDMGDEKWVLKQ